MSKIDFTKCDTCGDATPGNDVTTLCDALHNLCDTHKADWWREYDAQTAIFMAFQEPQA
jgi:hypothetical protein